jgi:hypothetical protein
LRVSPGTYERKEKRHAQELRDLNARLKNKALDTEDLQMQLDERDTRLRNLAGESKALLREKEKQLRSLQAALDTNQKALSRQAGEEVMDLKSQVMEKDKRHVKEIQGLAKQIQYLRARCVREERFRESLGYQKRFFLMMIEVYGQW